MFEDNRRECSNCNKFTVSRVKGKGKAGCRFNNRVASSQRQCVHCLDFSLSFGFNSFSFPFFCFSSNSCVCYRSVMDNIEGANSSATDPGVANVESDLHLGRGYVCQPRRAFLCKQDALVAALRWEYGEYAK